MMRSLYSAISGLKNHQIRMDVIGNNIANVNTLGFKRNTVTFKEQFSQTMSAASGPTNATGGSNAKQIGLGVTIGGIEALHSPGSIQYTGAPFDMAIDGDGYFVVKNGDTTYYTRAGNFTLNKEGTLVDASGNLVQFVPAKYNPAVADAKSYYSADLPATPGDPLTSSKLTLPINSDIFSSVSVTESGAVIGILAKDMTGADLNLALVPPVTDVPANLTSGTAVALGFVQLATFPNPAGLQKIGNNLYSTSDNSGDGAIATPGYGTRGAIAPSSLEMSNTDMAEEMVSMIVTQRGFQANSRIISNTDTMLDELVNLKR